MAIRCGQKSTQKKQVTYLEKQIMRLRNALL